ncbi:unnamed protein product [Adineta ricciae]|uniref:C-type lectin domain-containing protein n=1 Tax=Adineta ricciae TaxID=249248 RepID=A0A815NJH3_ADIRI|nr:unnamed protein product [Adineta ricciae]CAF1654538.1 unnamed protein product [Adineta ricciae]
MACIRILCFFVISNIHHVQVVTGKLGVTAVKQSHSPEFGIDYIGCRDWTNPTGMNCNPYQGDTDCNAKLPMLCVRVDQSPRPPYLIYGEGAAMPAANYAGWNGGHVSTTLPTEASRFRNRAEANRFCAETLGEHWEIAGIWGSQPHWISGMNGTKYAGSEWTANKDRLLNGGWSFYTYGNVRNDTRFWIQGPADQSSTCWGH